MMKKYKRGLVLGGGGARGIAHLGVAKALYENNLKPNVISGVSAGAIAGVLLASGLEPDYIFEKIKSNGFFKYSKIIFPKTGLFTLEGLGDFLKKEIAVENIEDLPIPCWIAISNITEGKIEYHNTGPLDKLVIASSSIPVIFEPVQVNGFQYVDGGLFDNLPVEPIRKDSRKVISVNLTPHINNAKLENLFQIAVRTFHLSIEANTIKSKKRSDFIIEPKNIQNYDLLQVKFADELFESGYNSAKEILKL